MRSGVPHSTDVLYIYKQKEGLEKNHFQISYFRELLQIRGHNLEEAVFGMEVVSLIAKKIYESGVKFIPLDLAKIFFELNEKVRLSIYPVVKPKQSPKGIEFDRLAVESVDELQESESSAEKPDFKKTRGTTPNPDKSDKKGKGVVPEGSGGSDNIKVINRIKIRWYEDEDINNIVEVVVNNELGGYSTGEVLSAYTGAAMPNQFVLAAEKSENGKSFIVAVTPAMNTHGIMPIDFFLDKTKQSRPDPGRRDERRDVFDEIMPILTTKDTADVKILFPYNISNTHWLVGEIILHKEGRKYSVEVYTHDPYGGGEMQYDKFVKVTNAIFKRIWDFDKEATITSSKPKISPYNCRQVDRDTVSCGVIVANDLIKRIKGETLDIAEPYLPDTVELRSGHIDTIRRYLPDGDRTREIFITRNTSEVHLPQDHTTYVTAATDVPSVSFVDKLQEERRIAGRTSRTASTSTTPMSFAERLRSKADESAAITL
jgi:hypothetical protein